MRNTTGGHQREAEHVALALVEHRNAAAAAARVQPGGLRSARPRRRAGGRRAACVPRTHLERAQEHAFVWRPSRATSTPACP